MAKDEFIEIEEIQVSPRGRKANLDNGLLEVLGSIPQGKALILIGRYPKVKEGERPKVSAIIRKHWKAVYGEEIKCRIDYTPDGTPQVRAR